MPFRIDVLDPGLTPERQAALVDVLVAHGVEREVADLVCAMTPGTVAEVATVSERDRLTSDLMHAGFGVRVAGSAPVSAPVDLLPAEADGGATAGTGPSPLAQLLGIVLGLLVALGLVALMVREPDAEQAGDAPADPPVAADGKQQWVTASMAGYVNVRSWPSIGAAVIGQVGNGQVVYTDECTYVAAENKTWCRSAIIGSVGWISQRNLQAADPSASSF